MVYDQMVLISRQGICQWRVRESVMSAPGTPYVLWCFSSIRRKDLAVQGPLYDTIKALSVGQIGKPQMRQLVYYDLFEFGNIGYLSYVDKHYLVFDVCHAIILVGAGSPACRNLAGHVQNFTGSHQRMGFVNA